MTTVRTLDTARTHLTEGRAAILRPASRHQQRKQGDEERSSLLHAAPPFGGEHVNVRRRTQASRAALEAAAQARAPMDVAQPCERPSARRERGACARSAVHLMGSGGSRMSAVLRT